MDRPGRGPSDELVERLAQQIDRYRLRLPMIMLLETTKPLSLIASQGILLLQPLLGSFLGETRIAEYAELLADRSNVEGLIARLEDGQPALRNYDGSGR